MVSIDSFFALVDEAAGVDDDHLGLFGLRDVRVAGRVRRPPSITSVVDAVLGAAEADEVDLARLM